MIDHFEIKVKDLQISEGFIGVFSLLWAINWLLRRVL